MPDLNSARWFELDISVGALLIMLAAYGLAFTNMGSSAWESICVHFGHSHPADRLETQRRFVLIVGASPKHEAEIALTVAPRGYIPVFMRTGHNAVAWLQTTNAAISIAVLEGNPPNANPDLTILGRLIPEHQLIRIGNQATSSEVARQLLDAM